MKTLLLLTAMMVAVVGFTAPILSEEPGFSSFEQFDQERLTIGPKPVDTTTYTNKSFDAYMKALKDGKYTIVLFHGGSYDFFSPRLVKKFGDAKLARYSDRVVFSVTDEDLDRGAKQLADALGVVRYPTLVILKTNNKNIHVAGRIEGVVEVDEIDRVLTEAMKDPIEIKK